jgi:hypothetical protein
MYLVIYEALGLEVRGQNKLFLGLTDEKSCASNDAFRCRQDTTSSVNSGYFMTLMISQSPKDSCTVHLGALRGVNYDLFGQADRGDRGMIGRQKDKGIRAHCSLRSWSLLGADTATSNKSK